MQNMYTASVNSISTTLSTSIDDTQTSINVTSGSVLPEAPNIITIGSDSNAETILYTSKIDNVLSGVTRGFQGTAKAWTNGEVVGRNYTAYDHDTFITNIEEALIPPDNVSFSFDANGYIDEIDSDGNIITINRTPDNSIDSYVKDGETYQIQRNGEGRIIGIAKL